MAAGGEASASSVTTTSIWYELQRLLATPARMSIALGPLAGLLIWMLPLGIEPVAHKTLAILACLIISWIVGAVEYGLTALCGCFLFWALRATPFDVAFSGFAQPTPWFVFAALLIGQAVARTGLAQRLGYLVIQAVGPSYWRLLFGVLTLALLLQLLVPSPNAQVVILAAVAIGLITAFGAGRSSNIATGFFLAITMGCSFFSRMFLVGAPSILAHGLIEGQTGLPLLWSHWALAFLPLTLLTLGAFWAIIYWLYPPEYPTLPGGRQYAREALEGMGPWSRDERRAFCWLVLAIALWGTDFLHHLPPTLIGIGLGLLLALPKVGVLDANAVKSVNFSLVIFIGGALSLGRVLLSTHALTHVTGGLVDGMTPLLTGSWFGPFLLYGSGVVYKFLSSNTYVMLSTGLPVFLDIAMREGLNPIAIGLVWSFAAGPMLFVYQASMVILAYSYGYFSASSLLKVGAILTVVEGLFIMVLVPVYWPLVGLAWNTEPSGQHAVSVQSEAALGGTADSHTSEKGQPGHAIMSPAALTAPMATGTTLRSAGFDADATAWASIRDSSASQDFIAFLTAFPQTQFAFAARMRLRQLLRASEMRPLSQRLEQGFGVD